MRCKGPQRWQRERGHVMWEHIPGAAGTGEGGKAGGADGEKGQRAGHGVGVRPLDSPTACPPAAALSTAVVWGIKFKMILK